MEDPEQQDRGEDVERDDAEADATNSVRPFTNPFLRNYDPLGPSRAQLSGITGINRMLRNPVLDTIARNAVIAASVGAAVKPPQLNIFSAPQSAAITGPPVWSKGVLDAVAVTTAWQRSIAGSVLAASVTVKPQLTFLNSAQITRFTGPPVSSKSVLAAAAKLSIPSSVRLFENNWVSSYTSPLSSLVLQAGSFQSSLHQIAGTISRVFTEDLFSRFDTLRGLFREWLPDNLRDVDAGVWMWLLRISAKDGTCLAWAPRAEIVAELLALRRSEDRQRCLMEHRLEVVEDVEAGLKEVDHPDLLDLRELTLQAAASIRDGHDAPAQALLANVLDTLMRPMATPGCAATSPRRRSPSVRTPAATR